MSHNLGLSFAQGTPGAAPSDRAGAAGQATDADGRSTAFRPVEGGNEMQSGEKLLVEAYAVIWIILFAVVLLSWRRQKAIDQRIDGLEQAIARARGESRAKGPAGATKDVES